VSKEPHRLVLDPKDPFTSAKEFLRRFYKLNGTRTLQYYVGAFYRFNSTTNLYVQEDAKARTLTRELYTFLDTAFTETSGGFAKFKPTKAKINNILHALESVCDLPPHPPAPCWATTDHPDIASLNIIAFQNGLLDVQQRQLLPPTPEFFTVNGLNFSFTPKASTPQRWLEFLHRDLWPNDDESIAALQEWMGYLLTPKTHLQKILMLVGPKRSGKGTIANVIGELVGRTNVCTPTLKAFGRQFGLSVLIAKTVAIIADARIGNIDTASVTERMLSISGEDVQTIPRKYRSDWTGKLPTRIMVLTNELPRIEDASGALASRYLILRMTKSFYGQEDLKLLDTLRGELPGILNWALEGLHRLEKRGGIEQPKSSTDLIAQFRELSSPMAAFIDERIENAVGLVLQKDLFNEWKTWCAGQNLPPGSLIDFARKFNAAMPAVKIRNPRVEGRQMRAYEGIRFRK
jgi:putative DNA primase/helicase